MKRKKKLFKLNYALNCAKQTAEYIYTSVIEKNEADKEFMIPHLFISMGTVIEGLLNNVLIDYFYHKLGTSHYDYVKTFLGLAFHNKLKLTVPLITDYQYELNMNKKDKRNYLKKIYEIIDIRNMFVHVKEHPFTYRDIDESLSILTPKDSDREPQLTIERLTTKDYKGYFGVYLDFAKRMEGLIEDGVVYRPRSIKWFKKIKKSF